VVIAGQPTPTSLADRKHQRTAQLATRLGGAGPCVLTRRGFQQPSGRRPTGWAGAVWVSDL